MEAVYSFFLYLCTLQVCKNVKKCVSQSYRRTEKSRMHCVCIYPEDLRFNPQRYTRPMLVMRVTFGMSEKVSPIFNFVNPVTTI